MSLAFIIIIVTVIISYKGFQDIAFFEKYNFNAYRIIYQKEYYRIVTHGFLHSNQIHLLFNMLTLFFTFSPASHYFGDFLGLFYISAIVISSLIDLYKYKNEPAYRSCGASGGVMAVLFALMIYSPWHRITLFFILPLSFLFFGVLFAVYSISQMNKQGERISHSVHLLGALYGLMAPFILLGYDINVFMSEILYPPSWFVMIFGQ